MFDSTLHMLNYSANFNEQQKNTENVLEFSNTLPKTAKWLNTQCSRKVWRLGCYSIFYALQIRVKNSRHKRINCKIRTLIGSFFINFNNLIKTYLGVYRKMLVSSKPLKTTNPIINAEIQCVWKNMNRYSRQIRNQKWQNWQKISHMPNQ